MDSYTEFLLTLLIFALNLFEQKSKQTKNQLKRRYIPLAISQSILNVLHQLQAVNISRYAETETKKKF